MAFLSQPVINCPNCGAPFQPKIDQVLDVGQDPSAKNRLVSGQATAAMCPNCGFANEIATPIVYHDPSKELLLINVPMELGMSQDEQETIHHPEGDSHFIRDYHHHHNMNNDNHQCNHDGRT